MAKMRIETAVTKLADRAHVHACRTCGLRYGCHCGDPQVNGQCSQCRLGQERPLWDRNHDPRPCCVTAQHVLFGEDVLKYALAGPGPWFRCQDKSCRRINGVRWTPPEED